MTWPTQTVDSTHIADPNQDPDQWRQELEDVLVPNHNQMVQARGNQDGVAPLDANQLVPLTNIPVVTVSRGGTGGTTKGDARAGLGLGDSAVRNVNVGNGVAGLNSSGEVFPQLRGHSTANAGDVWTTNGWASPIPSTQGWIKQSMLSTSMSEITKSGVSRSRFILPGGTYGFYPQCRADPGNDVSYDAQIDHTSNNSGESYATRLSINCTGGSSSGINVRVQQRYINASPPYDMGDGDVYGFIFVLFRDRRIDTVWMSDDPPWAHNGPTDIDTGYKRKSLAELADPRERERYLLAIVKGTLEPVAEGQALKQYDMSVIPTPFQQGLTVALIDPMGDECQQLFTLARQGHAPGDFLAAGYLTLDNEPLKRHGPPHVPVVRARWARTR